VLWLHMRSRGANGDSGAASLGDAIEPGAGVAGLGGGMNGFVGGGTAGVAGLGSTCGAKGDAGVGAAGFTLERRDSTAARMASARRLLASAREGRPALREPPLQPPFWPSPW
jgi:hypothetical protein